MWYLYILKCSDESLYTGVTIDLERRISEHNSKIGAKYVRSKLPAVLIYQEKYTSKSEAFRRETEIKGWRREKKLKLIQG